MSDLYGLFPRITRAMAEANIILLSQVTEIPSNKLCIHVGNPLLVVLVRNSRVFQMPYEIYAC